MGLFSKNKVSHEAEREALELEAAVMARIATITTSHDKQSNEEDEADLELLASMSAVSPSAAVHELAGAESLPGILLAEAVSPSPLPGMETAVPDYTSRIPQPFTLHQVSEEVMEAAPVAGPVPELITGALIDDHAPIEAISGFAEQQTPFGYEPAVFATPAGMEFIMPPSVEAAEPANLAMSTPDLQAESFLHEPPVREVEHEGRATPFALTAEQIAADDLMQETTKHLRSIGAVNILVAGQTGVGKSTLVNSVFGEEFAATSAGSPVTQHAEWFASDNVPLRILDTRGLEAKDYSVTLNALQAEIINSRAQHDERNQLHMAWVCISTPSSRVQECEIDIIRLLNKYDIPVLIVLTKYDDDEDFPGIVRRIMDTRGVKFTDIVPVRALSRKTRPAYGLEELVTATFTALPVAHKAAFAAAQKINRDLNRTTAETYVTIAASAAAAASVIPIPFADMATLAPIQASMLVGISNAFGVTLEKTQIMQLITTVLGCLAVTMAGGWIVGSVLKFIPGPGSVIGAMLNATVAGALTRTLGRTYIRFLYAFLEVNRRLPTADEIFDLFPTFYKAGRKKAAA